jgi:hypothetical protein
LGGSFRGQVSLQIINYYCTANILRLLAKLFEHLKCLALQELIQNHTNDPHHWQRLGTPRNFTAPGQCAHPLEKKAASTRETPF